MKSKFLIILLGLVLALSACNGDATDKYKCYQSVRNAYPKAIILTPRYGSYLSFVVIDTISKPNNYYIVRTGSAMLANITSEEILIPQND